MAATELFQSRKTVYNGTSSTQVRKFYVASATDEDDAETQISAIAPASVSVKGISLTHIVGTVTPLDGTSKFMGSWAYSNSTKASENSSSNKPLEVEGDISKSASFSGQNVRISEGRGSNQQFGTDAPNFGALIEVDERGNVNGIDGTFPGGTIRRAIVLNKTVVTEAFEYSLFDYIGKINQLQFGLYKPYELLMLSLELREQSRGGNWTLEAEMAVSKESTIKDPQDNDVTKPGWYYAWNYYKTTDGPNGVRVPKSIGLFLSDPQPEADFLQLPIPTW